MELHRSFLWSRTFSKNRGGMRLASIPGALATARSLFPSFQGLATHAGSQELFGDCTPVINTGTPKMLWAISGLETAICRGLGECRADRMNSCGVSVGALGLGDALVDGLASG